MTAPVVSFDGMDINDGSVYSIQPGIVLGAPATTFAEYRGYDGNVTQANVTTAQLVQMSIPMMIQGDSVADLGANIAALNTIIAGCSASSPKDLYFDGVTYSIVSSSEIAPTLEQSYQLRHFCLVDLVLNRLPSCTGTPGGGGTGGVALLRASWYNVQDYGATGNGTSDDTAAIQDAIDACALAGGGTVFVPVGTYIVSSADSDSAALTMKPLVTLQGDGPGTVIKMASDLGADAGYVLWIGTPGDDTVGVDCHVRDLVFDGNHDGNTGHATANNAPDVVAFRAATDCSIERVEVYGAMRNCVAVNRNGGTTYDADDTCYRIAIRDCYLHDAQHQCLEVISVDGLTVTGNTITDWSLVGATTAAGVYFTCDDANTVYNRNVVFTGNSMKGHATYGGKFAVESGLPSPYTMETVIQGTFSGNLFDGNGAKGCGISGCFHQCSFTGNSHVNGTGNWGSGYEIAGSDIVISGNTVEYGSITIPGNGSNTYARVTISGNVINAGNPTADAGNGAIGIATAGDVEDVVISGNIVRMCAGAGDQMSAGIGCGDSSSTTVFKRIYITGNEIYGNGTALEDMAGGGVRLYGASGSTDVKIAENRITNCYYAFRIGASAQVTQVDFINNDCRGNGNGISLWTDPSSFVLRKYGNVWSDDQYVTAVAWSGTGSPEGVVKAPVGSFYIRTDGGSGTTLYAKVTGTGSTTNTNTGWVAI